MNTDTLIDQLLTQIRREQVEAYRRTVEASRAWTESA